MSSRIEQDAINLRSELSRIYKPKYNPVPVQKWFSQIVTNGTFDTDTTGWLVFNSTLSVVANRLRITLTGVNPFAYQGVETEIGKTYNASVEFTAGTATTWLFRIGTTVGGTELYDSGVITASSDSMTFVATSTTTYIEVLVLSSTVGQYADFDNISVREVYELPSNILISKVFDNGSLLTPDTDYTVSDDGFVKTINFTVEPNDLNDVLVEYYQELK